MGRHSHAGTPPTAYYPPMHPTPPRFIPPPPRHWTPWLVPLIFLANSAIFVYTMYLNDCPSLISPPDQCIYSRRLHRFSFQPLSENPFLGPRSDTLRELGALDKELVLNEGEGWRFVTSMFLHAGVIHLLLNMFSLLVTGVRLERETGFWRIGVLYMLAGFGGGLLSMMHMKTMEDPSISVGASGALFGLLGSMLSELLTNWSIYTDKCSTLFNLVIVIALNLAIGFLPGVDNSAHIGGFISGFLLGFVLLMRPQYGYVSRKDIPPGYHAKHKAKHTICQYTCFVIALILAIAGYAYALANIYLKLPEKYGLPRSFPELIA
ncbi:RHOMBOID-like protein 5 [Senna tora]|uniref:RHOMBOID-like protein n=1 Tax=Senna tora TaxID=362788 RepID=A0A835CI80_9FABA|nr:RHOMBOID-like protein 5 [Senna tora]